MGCLTSRLALINLLSIVSGLTTEAVQQIEAVYARLPQIACRGLCHGSCGPIVMQKLEMERMIQSVGFVPAQKSVHCPMLTPAGRCMAYQERPMICRLWGLTKKMRCPFGCQPTRWLTDIESGAFLREIERVAGAVTGFDGALDVFNEVRDAIEKSRNGQAVYGKK